MIGRTAIVTGGASGLGAALVRRLRLTGWDVTFLDRNEADGEALADETGARFHAGDVTRADAWSRVIEQIRPSASPLGKVFLNAGIMTRPPAAAINDDIFDWMDKGAYQRVMSVNVDGALLGLRATLPLLAAAGGGSVTVTSSAAGLGGLAFDPFYAMSKHAVVGMVRSFAPVFKRRGVRLNVFCPGAMDTAILPADVVALGYETLSADEAAASCIDVDRKSVV